jgi:hypothetical protein
LIADHFSHLFYKNIVLVLFIIIFILRWNIDVKQRRGIRARRFFFWNWFMTSFEIFQVNFLAS